MEIDKKTQEKIIDMLSGLENEGSTITQIQNKLNFERHTLSKYLSFMAAKGILYYRNIGKAKLWYVNRSPLKRALITDSENKSVVEEILSNFMSYIPYGLITIDSEDKITFMNKIMISTYGNQNGKKIQETIFSQSNAKKIEKIRLLLSDSELIEISIQDKNGRLLKIKGTRLTNPDSSFSAMLIIEDITEEIELQEQLFEQKTLLEAEREALNRSAIVAETDLNGVITYVNDKFVEISGYSKDELIGKTHRIINSGYHSKSFFDGMWQVIKKGKIWRGVIRNKAKNGSYYWVDSTIAPIIGKRGKPIKYMAIRFEITKWRKLEEKIKDG